MRFLEEKMYIYDYITKNETIIEQIVIQETNKTFIIGVIYSFLFMLFILTLASWYSYFMWIRSPKIQAFKYIINNL